MAGMPRLARLNLSRQVPFLGVWLLVFCTREFEPVCTAGYRNENGNAGGISYHNSYLVNRLPKGFESLKSN